ncbi:MAG: hypothetical protein QME94_13240, partial [Anaerolineae bacterium]|nr:hypothetical protein [Anaerolineae bacterium]
DILIVLFSVALMAGVLAFALWIAVVAVSALPRVGRASPTALLTWAGQLGMGQAPPGEWLALGVSLALVAVALGGAWLHFRQQEQ